MGKVEDALAIMDRAESMQRRCRRNAAMNVINKVAPTPRKPMVHHEYLLQCECISWFRYFFPNILIWDSLNGVPLTNAQANREVKAGMLKGLPDLQIAAARKGFHGLFIEMKNGKKGVVREEQMEILTKLRAQGYLTAVARTKAQFVAIVNEYFGTHYDIEYQPKLEWLN